MNTIDGIDTLRKILATLGAVSGAGKVLAPKSSADMWPRLPGWFWTPAGIWEITAGIQIFKGGRNLDFGLVLEFIFMGGVLSSVVYIKDENGNTHFSGKGKLGKNGKLLIIPGLVWSAIHIFISMQNADSDLSPALIALCEGVGFAWGVFCANTGTPALKKD